MIRRISCFFCALILCLGLGSARCAAAVPDPGHPCSLTLCYTQDAIAFPDLEVEIYRVAELSADGEYKLAAPFSGYPIHIHGITSQQEWQDTAQTIKSYIAANQIGAYQSQRTDDTGTAVFTDLETGLYLVKGTIAHNANGTYAFSDFMIYLPTPVDSDYDYDVEANPKCTHYTPPASYTVVKLWNDSASSDRRPVSVHVDILKDGVVQESVILNGANNWSYSWNVPDGDGDWSVMEKDVPAGYQVSITSSGTAFVITNTLSPVVPDEPDTPDEPTGEIPETGDTSPLYLYIIIMCISGFGLMILGICSLRGRSDEKKR